MTTNSPDLSTAIRAALGELRAAAAALNRQPVERFNACLRTLADLTEANTATLLDANAEDLARMDPADPKYDRLELTPLRLRAIAEDLRRVAELPSPLGRELENRALGNGLRLRRLSVPIGVVGVVFESRPNVTFDVFALNLKAGNATVLKGSRDAAASNLAIKKLIDAALITTGLPAACYLAPAERSALAPILQAVGLVDVIIPRGSQGLIDFVRDNASVPVIETGAGICHTYVDATAHLDWARNIITNAKSRRVSVCNALDCLLLHRRQLPHLPGLLTELGEKHRCEVYADPAAYAALEGYYPADLLHAATADSFGTEFLSMRLAIKTVDDLAEATEHIGRYGSRHSEAIVSDDPASVERFLREVDAAVVYANTSTAFTDGGQFELGAEIGISTQKLHARGPMGLDALTSYKWLVEGEGQVRE
ncbi:glutamate-5-semialdehyde dehydrogenase [Neolewinella lacunae]|uniref:Gamma-glutamyl phosphate reductase n=1 Tax=Neolewinella lacunae TaxID=1517758 RepID=A0A923T9M1_9BACT|nr:glutamate-5-semialdehyde dehydrogenase [Neolewinella lacunae]MBC6995696.1 glutamate-5-semialdehyde dehydrogenase [Neolewinella lacunae]MDN3636611.1 glutamate-5-semialdehyde dehydrogenase [Neolewinella lacunae]